MSTKMMGEMGHPCLVPEWMRNGSDTYCTTLRQASSNTGTQGSFFNGLRRRTECCFFQHRKQKKVRHLTHLLRCTKLISHRTWERIIMVSLRWNLAQLPHHLCPNWFLNHDAQVKLVRHLLLLCIMVHRAIDLLFLVLDLVDMQGSNLSSLHGHSAGASTLLSATCRPS
jgi:hypothetical protein